MGIIKKTKIIDKRDVYVLVKGSSRKLNYEKTAVFFQK